MKTVEKSNFNYSKWLMIGFLSTSIIAFIIMMTLTPKLKGDDLIFSVLIGYSVIGFIIGMFFFVAYLVNWISAAGFGIFILLMVFGIYLSGFEKYGAIGGLSFPFSMGIFGFWLYWFNFGSKQRKNKVLLKTGLKATGILVSYEQSGSKVTTNANFPRYGVTLEIDVQINGKFSFHSKAEEMLSESEIFRITEGMSLTIRYNPENTEFVAVESWPAII